MTPPVRTCLGCRGRLPKDDLTRLVWNNDTGAVVVDAKQVQPGRGCYVHPECADQVARRKLVGRALRRTVDGDQVAALLAALAAGAPA